MNENNKQMTVYAELFYVLGLIILAFGTALMEKADFGMSMIVAPAYVLHLKVSQTFAFFSFGMAEYTFQFVLLILMMIVLRKFKLSYFFSFVTAVIYGNILDLCMGLAATLPADTFGIRVVWYLAGMVLCAIGVAMLFHTYLAPEVYELCVKVISEDKQLPIPKVKTVYDCISCLFSVVLSFAFFGFGHFEGVKLGTIICALINGSIIGFFDVLINKYCQVTRLVGEAEAEAEAE